MQSEKDEQKVQELEKNHTNWMNFFKKFFPLEDELHDEFVSIFLNDRLLSCPRSLEKENGGDYGQLVRHSLDCINFIRDNQSFLKDLTKLNSLIRLFLIYELGKIGDETNSLYLEQNSDWHIKQGLLFKYNEKIPKLLFNHRTLFLLQKYNIKLTHDEFLTLLTLTNQGSESSFYTSVQNDNKLALTFNYIRNLILNKSKEGQ